MTTQNTTVGARERWFQNLGTPEILLSVTAIFALFAFLGWDGLKGSEDRWAEIVREMRISGDYLHPAINGLVYYDKPILSYWLIAVAAWCFRTLNEMVLRLPSAVFGLIALWATYSCGKRIFDRTTALCASWLLLGSYGFLWFGRLAEADMGNMATTVLAVAFFLKYREKANFGIYLVFYLICVFGMLLKGVPALLVPLAVILPFLFFEKLLLRHLKVSNFLALVIAGGVFYGVFYLEQLFPMPEYYSMPPHGLNGWELFVRENITRATAAFDHKDEPFFCYLYHIPRLLLPWAPVSILAWAAMVIRFRSLSQAGKALLIANLMVLLLFSASESRRWYYILPIMPFAMLCSGWFCVETFSDKWKLKRILFTAYRYVLIVGGSLAVISLLLLPFSKSLFGVSLPLLLVVSLPLFGMVTLLVMFFDERAEWMTLSRLTGLPRSVAGVILGGCIMTIGGFGVIKSSFDEYRTLKPFGEKMRQELPANIPPEDILFFGPEANATLCYYVNWQRPIQVAGDMDHLLPELAVEFFTARKGKPTVLLVYSKYLDELREILPELPVQLNPDVPDYIEGTVAFENKKKRKIMVWTLDASGKSPASVLPAASPQSGNEQ